MAKKSTPRQIETEAKGSSKTIPIDKRNIGVCFLLSIVTLGIFKIYWQYLLVKNTRVIRKDHSSCAGEMLCLILVPFYSLYWWYTRGRLVKDEFAKHGRSVIDNKSTYLILGILGFDFVSMAIMQNDFNSLSSASIQSIWQNKKVQRRILTTVLSLISVVYILPILIVVINSFKDTRLITSAPFAIPTGDIFVGFSNYTNGITHGNYPFYLSILYSLVITLLSTFLILLCTSMAAWYINRVNSPFCKIIYYLCIFSMVVPFQMVMFTLAKTADTLHLNTPYTIPLIYLGFGAGLAVFMFSGFVKGIPLEIEEAATIDGCGPLQTFFLVVAPIMKPTFLSVGILETMWIWNDYLLPYLVLDRTKYMTIPIHIQFLQGSYGSRDMGAIMALIILCLIPIVVFYFSCQKHIIKGVIAGAVKG